MLNHNPSPDRKFLEKQVSEYQEIQKRNPPESVEWIKASKEINALAKILAVAE